MHIIAQPWLLTPDTNEVRRVKRQPTERERDERKRHVIYQESLKEWKQDSVLLWYNLISFALSG